MKRITVIKTTHKVDKDSKLIVDYSVTGAEVHDSQEIEGLIDEKDNEAYADSAYAGKELYKKLLKKSSNIKLKIHEKGYKK
jgi:hypothetical protein